MSRITDPEKREDGRDTEDIKVLSYRKLTIVILAKTCLEYNSNVLIPFPYGLYSDSIRRNKTLVRTLIRKKSKKNLLGDYLITILEFKL